MTDLVIRNARLVDGSGADARMADVSVTGDRITGEHRPGVGARFYFNGRLRVVVDDANFSRAFFAIWLSPDTSEPRLRNALLQGGTP